MRRQAFGAQMIALALLLSACGGETGVGASKAEELSLQIRTEYLAMTECTGQMTVTADYGERVYDYGMSFAWSKEEGTTLTLIEPEDMVGISVRIEAGETALEYDGVRIETGALNADGLSPVDAVPALLRCVNEGFIAACGEELLGETEVLRVTYRDPEVLPGTGVETSVWFDSGTHALVQGEISQDGTTIVQCAFRNFQKA